MHVLAIDIGSYSVKYISSFVDRRKINHVDMSEVIVRDFMADHPELTREESFASIVQEIIDSVARPDTKVIYQIDHQMMTTRFLTLPVKSKKKAELMLPFQLEEDIPYALSEIHYAYRMEGQKTQHTAMVELVRTPFFEEFYNMYRDMDILPNILTTESSSVENYFNQNPMAGPFCVLDVGHKTTKGYFFYNSRLFMTHVSYIGGHHVNEMIAETYKIETDEAIIYKHQNAFLLTSTQYEEVDPAQREFALAMDKVFSHLVADFSRWKVGFKVNYGLTAQHVFLCGGSSNIKNIANYLSEKWDIKVTLLESFDKVESEKIDLNPKNKSKYALANMMATGFRRKNRFINLLTGRFAQASTSEVPLHSLAFVGVRVFAASLVLAISLLAERYFIEKDIASVNAKMGTVMKNPELQLPGRLRRQVTTNPKPVYDTLVRKQRDVKQEISTLQSAVQIQALSPLVTVSQIAASATGATLTEFIVEDSGEIRAVFSAESIEELSKLKNLFEKSALEDVEARIDQTKLLLTVKAFRNS
ncbi:MAG: pilus assembly protein PilM [Bacteriovoracia bacterium]